MARQESAAAGRGDSAADVVIVGESKLPVAIMRQPEQSPWLAVDDDDDDADGDRSERKVQKGARGNRRKRDAGKRPGGEGRRRSRSRRRRRESIDESGDPATALSVVSEQLWGLQQKLVGTYMAVARARLRRAFPDPALVATSSERSPPPGTSSTKYSQRTNAGAPAGGGGGGSRRPGKQKSVKAADADEASGPGNGQLEDGPDEETRLELVRGALVSLTDAWEHLVEAKGTIDRRSAIVFSGEKEEPGEGKGGDARASRGVAGDDESADDVAIALPMGEGFGSSRKDERADNLGSLWKGSLSEALARSVSDRGSGSGGGGHRLPDGEAARVSAGAAAGGVIDANGAGTTGGAGLQDVDGDVMARLAWTRAARRQLEARRAELFELCGDVSHACLSLRARAAGAGITAAPPSAGGSVGGGIAEALRSLPAQLEKLLSSAHPPLVLQDLDVCRDLHGRVWESLSGGGELAGSSTNTSSSASVGGKKARGSKKRPTQAEPDAKGTPSPPDDCDEGADHVAGTAGRYPPPLAETCVHSLARDGFIPGDSTAWSLCLAAEACYERALFDLGMVAGIPIADAPGAAAASAAAAGGAVAVSGVPEAQARIRKKLGDASNELGKLMAQCAGALVQAPSRPVPSEREAARPSPTGAPDSVAAQPPHPGLGCAVCVACAERWFRRSLAQFRAIDDARNTALLLCNLASVERLKPRAIIRLREVCPCPPAGPSAPSAAPEGSGGKRSGGGGSRGAAKEGVSAHPQGKRMSG